MDAWVLSWDDGRLVLAISRRTSLTAAARSLRVNQSTVSRQLAALERRLQTRLFERTANGYRPTSSGERILPRLERVEEELLAVQREAIGAQAQLTGTVRLTSPVAFSSHFLAPRLGPLCARLPHVTLELIGDNRALSLSQREADLALRLNRPTEAYLIARKVGQLGAALYASPSYLASRPHPRAGSFEGHDLLEYEDSFKPSAETRWLRRHAAGGRVVLRANATLSLLKAAQAGVGLAVLPCYLAESEDGLERVLPASASVLREIWLASHRDLRHTARVREVADGVAQLIAKNARLLLGR